MAKLEKLEKPMGTHWLSNFKLKLKLNKLD